MEANMLNTQCEKRLHKCAQCGTLFETYVDYDGPMYCSEMCDIASNLVMNSMDMIDILTELEEIYR
jgi:hypothetical protein